MLNYIWLSLLAFGIFYGLASDVSDIATNKYHNGEAIPCEIILNNSNGNSAVLKVNRDELNSRFSTGFTTDIQIPIDFKTAVESKAVSLKFPEKETGNINDILTDIEKNSGDNNDIHAEIKGIVKASSNRYKAELLFENVRFTKMKSITNAAIDYSKTAVDIALGLIGIMAFWLGIMKIAESAGLVKLISRSVKPITKWFFPEVPSEHPAVAAMIMNISANMLGLGNAATPFGLKAMEELDKLNPEKGTATNAMCMFLAINTAGLTLVPATAIAVRAAQGSSDPTIIIGTSFFGALIATITGISVAKLFESFNGGKFFSLSWLKSNSVRLLKSFLLFFILIVLFVLLAETLLSGKSGGSAVVEIIRAIAVLAIPLLIAGFVLYGAIKKVKLYEVFVEGAKEGFTIAVRIIPYLVAMLVAIGIFRASGGMDLLATIVSPITNLIGMPAEVLPMALMRPLSGSASIGIMAELMSHYGPDSFIGVLSSTILGSTETTFYVLALYFGAINIRRTRHAVIAGVSADIAGILAALFIVRLIFGLL